jgi:flagellar basal body rod protein FlgB
MRLHGEDGSLIVGSTPVRVSLRPQDLIPLELSATFGKSPIRPCLFRSERILALPCEPPFKGAPTDMMSLIPDNLTELLLKILQFTEQRRDVLYHNMDKAQTPEFTPKDMPVLEFARALNSALAEHVQNHRLLFCDTQNIKFGPNSSMQIMPVADSHAQTLRQEDPNQYLEYQVNKLLENSLNRKIASQLLKFNQGTGGSVPPFEFEETAANASLFQYLPTRNTNTN